MRHLIIAFFCCSYLAAADGPALTEREVDWKDGEVALRGFQVTPVTKMRHQQIALFPEWWGVNDYARSRARDLARAGFAVLVVDLYGAGQVTTDPAQAGAWARPFYADRALMLRRARAGLAQIAGDVHGTIGFCFGGTVALELARDHQPIARTVALHAGLKTAAPAAAGAISGKILVLHGGADPLVPPADVAAFITEMTAAKADWRMEVYGRALHAFSNPAADSFKLPPVAYDADAECRALAQTLAFFAE